MWKHIEKKSLACFVKVWLLGTFRYLKSGPLNKLLSRPGQQVESGPWSTASVCGGTHSTRWATGSPVLVYFLTVWISGSWMKQPKCLTTALTPSGQIWNCTTCYRCGVSGMHYLFSHFHTKVIEWGRFWTRGPYVWHPRVKSLARHKRVNPANQYLCLKTFSISQISVQCCKNAYKQIFYIQNLYYRKHWSCGINTNWWGSWQQFSLKGVTSGQGRAYPLKLVARVAISHPLLSVELPSSY